MRYVVEISYQGANYHGWQRQNNASSVQAEVEKVISTLVGEVVQVHGCGRTDSGVHALQYFFHFDAGVNHNLGFIYKLNQMLPVDISCKNYFKVPDGFNSRFDAEWREYIYKIHQLKDPFLNGNSWLFKREMNISMMNRACEILKEQEDFSSFQKSKTQNKTNICHIHFAQWSTEGSRIFFEIRADRFLRNMVRAIVGTMIEVGLGNISLKEFKDIILAKNRQKAGFSVPAHGLYLKAVSYNQSEWVPVNQMDEQ